MMKKMFVAAIAIAASVAAHAQVNSFPKMEMTKINGAPDLEKPVLVMGETKPVYVEKTGLAYPVMFDVDRDGKKDLLIGEFASDKKVCNSYIKVYKNIGKKRKPKFSNDWYYLKDTEGDLITVLCY